MSKKKFELLELSKESGEYIKKVYEWYKDEEHMEYYTCRPTTAKKKNFEEYRERIFKSLDSKDKIFILTLEGKALGKITLLIITAGTEVLNSVITFRKRIGAADMEEQG